tara:strand:- start:242 stop:529 length:288 start_codon:yes stop_codon:yes gene_type:complete
MKKEQHKNSTDTIEPIEINTAIIQPFKDLLQDNFDTSKLIAFAELPDQDWNFKEAHEKLCKEWLNLDTEMEKDWKELDAYLENWHNDFTEIPAFE